MVRVILEMLYFYLFFCREMFGLLPIFCLYLDKSWANLPLNLSMVDLEKKWPRDV